MRYLKNFGIKLFTSIAVITWLACFCFAVLLPWPVKAQPGAQQAEESTKPTAPAATQPTAQPALQTNESLSVQQEQTTGDSTETTQPTFDGKSAYETLKSICALGTRTSGTEGMRKQQELLKTHFESLGAQVYLQKFSVRHPENGNAVEMCNLAVRFHPERKQRVLLCCHYDTRPFPDQDKDNPRGIFLGANDGASGVALLHELGKHLPALAGKYGVDFIFFDAEEFVFEYHRDAMFLGSTYFANEYAAGKWPANYTYAVLIDMIGDKHLEIYYEGNSMEFAPRLTRSIWGVAKQLGVKSFVPKERHKIRDDHLPLNSIARIRTCDIIDFDYPTAESNNAFWHTTQDLPENCSADSLTQVGWVLLEWLKEMEKLN